jgi:hypothetical protein
MPEKMEHFFGHNFCDIHYFCDSSFVKFSRLNIESIFFSYLGTFAAHLIYLWFLRPSVLYGMYIDTFPCVNIFSLGFKVLLSYSLSKTLFSFSDGQFHTYIKQQVI